MEFSFFFLTSSLHLLGLQLIKLQFAQVKNVSTKSLDVSLPPFHKGGHNSTFKKFMKNINGFFGMKPSSNSQTLLQVYVHEETFFTTRKRWEKPFLSKKKMWVLFTRIVWTGDFVLQDELVNFPFAEKKNTLNDYFSFSLVLHQLLSAILKS